MNARRPVCLGSRIAKLFRGEYHSIAVNDGGVIEKTFFSGWGKRVVV